MTTDSAEYSYRLDNQFFSDLDTTEIQKGSLDVELKVTRTSGIYQLNFRTEGYVIVTCDRCLEEMEQPIDTTDVLKVKLGEAFSEINDIVVVPEEDGYINIAWFMYEFIALNIPMKHVHALGKCNKDMVRHLNKHLRTSADENDFVEDEGVVDDSVEREIDPRWNELKKILDNN